MATKELTAISEAVAAALYQMHCESSWCFADDYGDIVMRIAKALHYTIPDFDLAAFMDQAEVEFLDEDEDEDGNDDGDHD